MVLAGDGATTAPTRVAPLVRDHLAPDRYGRTGDLVLALANGVQITVASAEDDAHKRDLRGAVVDLATSARDTQDPLIAWRTGVLLADGSFSPVVAPRVESMRCDDGRNGIKVIGDVAGVRIETHYCASAQGTVVAESRIVRGQLSAANFLADELSTGASALHADVVGTRWRERVDTPWLAFAHDSLGAAIVFDRARLVTRRIIEIEAEVFEAESHIRWEGRSARRTLVVSPEGLLGALAQLPSSVARGEARFADARGGTVHLYGSNHQEIASLNALQRTAPLRLPPSFGVSASLEDRNGIRVLAETPLGPPLIATRAEPGVLRATYVNERDEPLAVHIIVRGRDGTADPTPVSSPRRFAARNTIDLLDGWVELPLAPGRYHVVATRGPTHTLSVRDVEIRAGAIEQVRDQLRQVVDTSRYTSADLHLHAAPSPDSNVTLHERVASLVCQGIELAVATDHNHVTDYGPAVRRLGVDQVFAAIAGDEVTTASPPMGHFNVFPLARMGHAGALPYRAVRAADIFASARQAGASVVQVNHARMSPMIGYFDQANFNAQTGEGGPELATTFDALEVFNGMHIEHEARVREALQDLVGLARRAVRVAATGNSDSHHLVIQAAGWPRTYVETPAAPIATRATRVMQAIREGRTLVSSGPLVELTSSVFGAGQTARLSDGQLRLRLRVSAPAWVPVDRVEIWLNGLVVRTLEVPQPGRDGLRLEQELTLPVTSDAVVFALASATAPLPEVLPYPNARSIGISGMLWVDENSDGEVRIPPAPSLR